MLRFAHSHVIDPSQWTAQGYKTIFSGPLFSDIHQKKTKPAWISLEPEKTRNNLCFICFILVHRYHFDSREDCSKISKKNLIWYINCKRWNDIWWMCYKRIKFSLNFRICKSESKLHQKIMKCQNVYIYIYLQIMIFSLLLIIAILWALLESTTRYNRIWTKKSRILMSKHAYQVPGFIVLSSRPLFPRSSGHWAKPKHTLPRSSGRTWFPRKEVSEGVWEAWGPILPFTRPFIYTSYMVMHMFSIIWWCKSRFSIIWWSTVLMVYDI